MNYKTRLIGLIIAVIAVAALILRKGDIAWMIFPFLIYLMMGIMKSPAAENVNLQAERKIVKNKSGDLITVDVSVILQNLGPEKLLVNISDDPQDEMEISEGNLTRWAILNSGETTNLNYQFGSKRGYFFWNTLRVIVSDPLGVVETHYQLAAKGEVKIQPQLKRFKPIMIHPHSTLHSPGSIPARLGGSGTNFWGVREYHPGDSLRWLDWRLTARYPHKFFTKEFEQEEIAEIGIILDARNKVEVKKGEESLFEYGVGAASSLAEMFLHQGHRVSLLVFGHQTTQIFPDYGKQQLRRILDCLAKVQISPNGRSLDNMDYIPIRMFPSRALIIVISPLAKNDWSFFPRLRGSGYQVLLISPDTIHFVQPLLQENPVNEMAIRAVKIERQMKLRNIANLRIGVINWRVEEPLAPLVRNAFTRARRHWE
jgi:uncharacterized protein (DUF58 family)